MGGRRPPDDPALRPTSLDTALNGIECNGRETVMNEMYFLDYLLYIRSAYVENESYGKLNSS